jgi:hypothetical protein
MVHFFNNKEYLFKTITMAGISQVEEICNTISAQKGWFWGRFAPSERQAYLTRRLFVEKELYNDYTQCYGSLKEKIPVYFYIYPTMTREQAWEKARLRTEHDESLPHTLLVRVEDIDDITNITFTLNDSFYAYWKKAVDAGLKIQGDRGEHVVLPDHNRVFPFSMIEQIHGKYKERAIFYEIQVWDYQLLEKMRYSILDR